MTLIGKKAPEINASAIINGQKIIQNFTLAPYLGKQNIILFFYPKDFTFICPTELFALQALQEEFAKRETITIACSTDTVETHWAWLHIQRKQGGIKGITYPIIADHTKVITTNYGVLAGEYHENEAGQLTCTGDPIAQRATFLIDKKGIIRQLQINSDPLGRNIPEMLRTLDMLDHIDTHGEVCPANWQQGQAGLTPNPQGLITYWEKHPSPSDKSTCCGNKCHC